MAIANVDNDLGTRQLPQVQQKTTPVHRQANDGDADDRAGSSGKVGNDGDSDDRGAAQGVNAVMSGVGIKVDIKA